MKEVVFNTPDDGNAVEVQEEAEPLPKHVTLDSDDGDVDEAVDKAVGGAVDGAVDEAVDEAVQDRHPVERPHVVLLLDAGNAGAAAICAMIAGDGHRCVDTATNVPVLLHPVPRLCESLSPEEEARQVLRLHHEAAAAPALKLLLVVEYAVIQMGPHGLVFALLVERVAAMLRDVGRFGDALGLVCTNVPLQSKCQPDGDGEDQAAEAIKAEITDFLKGALLGLHEGALGQHLEAAFRSRFAAVVSCLVEGGEQRVALLRCPDGPGVALRGSQPDDVLRLLWTATRWQTLQPGDVDRTLPLWLRPNIARSVFSLQEALAAEASKTVAAAEAHLRDVLQEAAGSHGLDEGAELLRKLRGGDDGWCCGDVPAVRGAADEVARLLAELHLLQTVIADDVVSASQQLVDDRKTALAEFTRRWELFLEFLLELGEYLWSYEVQSRRWTHAVRFGLGLRAENVHSFLRLLVDMSGLRACAAFCASLAGSAPEPLMLQLLNRPLDEALRHEVAVTRQGSEITVTGVCIVLSEVLGRVSDELGPWRQSLAVDRRQIAPALFNAPAPPSAPPPEPDGVVLLALDTVFLDREWDAGKLKLAVVAPRWFTVEGGQAILLNGASGTAFGVPATADKLPCAPVEGVETTSGAGEGLEVSKTGECGAPGLAGGAGQAAGALFGVLFAVDIVDGHLLSVSACGGHGRHGADGQDGGPGGDGEDGQDATSGFLTAHRASGLGDVTSVVTVLWNMRSRKFYGSAGGRGGKGGEGGRGGAAGHAGEVAILSVRKPPQAVRVVAKDGRPGAAGRGGRGGKGGRNGKDCTGTLSLVLFVPVSDRMVADDSPDTFAESGDVGESGSSLSSCREKELPEAEPAVIFDDEEKDAVMEAFVRAFAGTAPLHTLPKCRREASDQLMRLAKGGWRLQHWYQQRTDWGVHRRPRASSARSSACSSTSTLSSVDLSYTGGGGPLPELIPEFFCD